MQQIRSLIIVWLLVGLFVLTSTAQAKSVGGRYLAHGAGGWSCADALAVYNGNNPRSQAELDGFLAGYFTAVNIIINNTYDILAGERHTEAKSKVMEICRANPEDTLGNATAAFTSDVYHRRHSLPPDLQNRRSPD